MNHSERVTMHFPKDNGWLEGSSPFGVTILVERDRLAENERLEQRVRALWSTNPFAHFELLDQRDVIVEGYPAIGVRWAWTTDSGAFVQDITFIEVTSALGERMCVSVWVTALRETASLATPLVARLIAAEDPSPQRSVAFPAL